VPAGTVEAVTDLDTTTFALAGRSVRRVGFGAMQLPGPGVMGPPRDRAEALAVLRRAVEHGVNHIDTAQYYGPDVANELIHEALHPYPEDLVLVTKVGSLRDAQGGWLPAQRPDQLRSAVEDNLRSLEIEQLGAVNLRLLPEHPPEDPAQVVPLGDQLGELAAMREEGKIAGVGISTASLAQVDQAIEAVGLDCVQNAFSLLDQADTPVLDRCAELGMAYVPYFPLGSAFPWVPKVTEHAPVLALAQARGLTPAQIGLAWLLARSANILLIPGTASLAHLEENLAVAGIQLRADELAGLEPKEE